LHEKSAKASSLPRGVAGKIFLDRKGQEKGKPIKKKETDDAGKEGGKKKGQKSCKKVGSPIFCALELPKVKKKQGRKIIKEEGDLKGKPRLKRSLTVLLGREVESPQEGKERGIRRLGEGLRPKKEKIKKKGSRRFVKGELGGGCYPRKFKENFGRGGHGRTISGGQAMGRSGVWGGGSKGRTKAGGKGTRRNSQ